MRRAFSIIVALLAGVAATAQSSSPSNTTVYVNGRVYTADAKIPEASSFAVADGKFVAVGNEVSMKSLLAKGATRVDLGGRFVMPGIADDHFHGTGGGSGVSLADVRSMAQLIAVLKKASDSTLDGTLVISNSDWHEAQLKEQRKPVVADLDLASKTVPIVVVRGGHSLFLNSAALARFGIDERTPIPAGGAIERDETGRLTGEIVDAAKSLVPLPKEPPLQQADLIATQQEMNGYGVTSVRIPGTFRKGTVLQLVAMAREMEKAGTLSLRYTVLRPGPGFAGGSLDALRSGPQQGDGNAWVKIDGVKLMVDGGFEGAHFSQPYAEPFGRHGTFSGLTVVPPEKTISDVRALHRMGWHVAVHAAGDAGIEQALDAFETAASDQPIANKRWSLEHAFVVQPAQVARIKALGVALSLQDHLYLAAPSMAAFWGRGRAERVTPVRTYAAAGILVAGGTDSPVIPANPFWAMYHFASRDTISAGVFGPGERVESRRALLDMFTINYSRLVGADFELGSITPGKRADFTVLDTDLLRAPVAAIRDTKALKTFVDGRIVYSRDAR